MTLTGGGEVMAELQAAVQRGIDGRRGGSGVAQARAGRGGAG